MRCDREKEANGLSVSFFCVFLGAGAQVGSMRGQKVMDTFYGRLKETWSYHTHHPGLPVRVLLVVLVLGGGGVIAAGLVAGARLGLGCICTVRCHDTIARAVRRCHDSSMWLGDMGVVFVVVVV